MLYQERPLEHEGHLLHEMSRSPFQLLSVGQLALKMRDCYIKAWICFARWGEFLKEMFECVRLLGDCSQHVQRIHISRSLPERIERCLSVEPGQNALLDVPVASQTLQGLGNMNRTTLRHPVFANGRPKSFDQLLMFARLC